jgi:sodium transport system permease protein
MRWSNLFIIFRREVRDQIRDRRTLFMIFVLPILLYPILGIGVIKFASALEQKPRLVVVVGAEYLPGSPVLLNRSGDGFNPSLFDTPVEAERIVVRREPATGPWGDHALRQRAIRDGEVAAVMLIPRDLPAQLQRDNEHEIHLPIQYNSVDEPSQITYLRLRELLERWRKSIVDSRLERDRKSKSYAEPIQVSAEDVATAREVGGSVWSRLFPFLLVMMALTGAFYPAIDLCAGEKERGTMETLLISPASRSEIVLGKFLTVMLASVTTAILNLLSMGLTGVQLAHQVGALSNESARRSAAASSSVIAPPTMQAAFWMILLLIPLAAFFSAVCVALAVLARSMKEGQYYMTPLYIVCMPLIFLTLMPGIELDLFYSLVPITGVGLLLRALILGNYDVALRFFLPVLVPTVVYAAVALRWAVDQFQREDVLFRESEQFSLSAWIRHLVRDRDPIPTGGEAVLCFALILTCTWFLMLYLARQSSDLSLGSVIAGQWIILLPPVLMGFILTSDPRRTLRLAWPEKRYLWLAVALVLALNPLVNELRPLVEWLFPISSLIKTSLEQIMSRTPGLLTSIAIFALIPAICEEFAFRGFILSGLEHEHRTRSAILLSALMFGFLHVLLSLFQQLFNATLLGIVLGLLAVRSRSIVPGIVFHFVNNAMAVALGSIVHATWAAAVVPWIYRNPDVGLYHRHWIGLSVLLSGVLLYSLWKRKPAHFPALAESVSGSAQPAC